jgi:hypothetical protein
MTQKDKELLLKDLCARLPYGVKVQCEDYLFTFDKDHMGIGMLYLESPKIILSGCYYGEDIKPYLFPLSSMTEEQKSYVNGRWGVNENFDFEIDPNWGKYFVDLGDAVGFINWCYENHFDINGLIPRGLAEDATDKNIY